jgi:4-hydroxy-tetrahydrodipicolinate reductase
MVIKVGVFGAGGRMGATVCQAVQETSDLELVAAVDPFRAGHDVENVTIAATADALTEAGAEVAVDFTVAEAARENLRWCAAHDVHAVVGTSGLTDDDLSELAGVFAASNANAVIAPNFAIGAVLMTRFAELAAPFFESAEIIELHHDNKIDAPSGTAVHTAQRMAAASKDWADDPTTKVVAEGARGGIVDGIPVHAVRLRGLVAHQEVVLGTTGQTLTIRHDTIDRSSFMPGVLLAVRKVGDSPGLTVGLDKVLGL